MSSPPPASGGGWQLVPYITASGRCPVREFLSGLREQAFAKYVEFEEVLRPEFEARGPFDVGPPYWENLGGGWHDIRWSGRCRVYCSVERPRLVVMYIGATKRWRHFGRDDQQTCERYRADFVSDDYDQEKREYLYRARQKRGANGTN